MAKLNLKTANPIEDKNKPIQGESAPVKKKTEPNLKDEERTVKITSPEDFFPREESKEKEPEAESPAEPQVPPNEEKKEPAPYFFDDYGDGGKKQDSSKKKFFTIFGIGAVIIIALIVALTFLMREGKKPATGQPAAAGETSEQPGSATGQTAAQTQGMLPIYQANLANNVFIENQLKSFLSGKPNSADYSLIVITPREINLTVLADSRDQVAKFHIDLKKAFPAFGFRILSVQPKFENDHDMFYADISGTIKDKPSSAPLPAGPFDANPQNLESGLRSLAQNDKVQMQYFKEGQFFDQSNYREQLCYANLQGTRTNIIKFLNDLNRKYPIIKINKFSVFPYNLAPISDNRLSTRINFSCYFSR